MVIPSNFLFQTSYLPVGSKQHWIQVPLNWRLWYCSFCCWTEPRWRQIQQSIENNLGERPELVFEALVSFKWMWSDCDWKRQFSECYSPTLLLIGDLHCHLTEVTNKGRPLPLYPPLLHQQGWYFTFFFFLQKSLKSFFCHSNSR